MKEEGFTLIELLVVVSIVLLLTATAIPAVQEFRNRATNVEVETTMHNLMTAIEAGHTDALNPNTNNAIIYKRFGAALVQSGGTADAITPGFPWSGVDNKVYAYVNQNPTCAGVSTCRSLYVFAGNCDTGHRQYRIVYGDGRVVDRLGYSSWYDNQC